MINKLIASDDVIHLYFYRQVIDYLAKIFLALEASRASLTRNGNHSQKWQSAWKKVNRTVYLILGAETPSIPIFPKIIRRKSLETSKPEQMNVNGKYNILIELMNSILKYSRFKQLNKF